MHRRLAAVLTASLVGGTDSTDGPTDGPTGDSTGSNRRNADNYTKTEEGVR